MLIIIEWQQQTYSKSIKLPTLTLRESAHSAVEHSSLLGFVDRMHREEKKQHDLDALSIKLT